MSTPGKAQHIHRPQPRRVQRAVSDHKLENLTVRELRRLAIERDLKPHGTGSRGQIIKADLIRALRGS